MPIPDRGAIVRFAWVGSLALVLGLALAAAPAYAAKRPVAHPRSTHPTALAGDPTLPGLDAELIVDGKTGKVLYARNETALRHPASLTKMMTLYLLFEALRRGDITMTTQMPVSAHAAAQKPTKLSLRRGQTIDVDTAIRAIVVRSANDVAVVIAEALGGTESHFAEMMTEQATQLGMKFTNYHNASGLPDPLQITTASDLAILAHHVAYDFPQYFGYFSLPGFTYHGTYYATHDNLIGRYDGADGIKTGYTGASGFNLVTSVVRGGVHIIGVVMGGRTAYRRDVEMARLLDATFAQIEDDPVLVERGRVPWQNLTQFASVTQGAGFIPDAAPAPQSPPTTVASLDPNDEDAAESQRDPDEDLSLIHANSPAPSPLVLPPATIVASAAPAVPASAPLAASPSVSMGLAPAIRPAPRPDVQIALATPPTASPPMSESFTAPAILPTPRPDTQVALATPAPPVTPQLRPEVGEGDIGDPGVAVGPRNWTIQIGAYADQNLARDQLASYAAKSMDVLGQADKIVVPFQSVDGHTLYRARFGLFVEQQARDVCDRLTKRGQTCFAAIEAR